MSTRRILRSEDKVAEEEALSGALVLLSNTLAPLPGYFTSEMSYHFLKHGSSEDITGSSLRGTVRQALAGVNWSDMHTSCATGRSAMARSPKYVCSCQTL